MECTHKIAIKENDKVAIHYCTICGDMMKIVQKEVKNENNTKSSLSS